MNVQLNPLAAGRKRTVLLLLFAVLLLSGIGTPLMAAPLCKGPPADRPPECEALDSPIEFDAEFIAGTFDFDSASLHFVDDPGKDQAISQDAVTVVDALGNWDILFGVCSDVLDPIPASVNVPAGGVIIQKSANVIKISFQDILVNAAGGLVELSFALQGTKEGYADVIPGTVQFVYEFTDIGVFARLAQGSKGSKKRCQVVRTVPEAYSELFIDPS